MRRVLLVILFVFVSLLFSQQTWEKTYGSVTRYERGLSVQQTSDGGYIITGWAYSVPPFMAYAVYLVKTDSFGDTIWTRCLGNQFVNMGFSVHQTADGGYIIAGYAGSSYTGPSDFYLIRTDTNGDTIWTRTYDRERDDEGYSLDQTADGGYIIAGCTGSSHTGRFDVYLVKTDSLGDTIWTRTYGGEEDDDARSVQQTADGGYIIAGWTFSFNPGEYSDVYLVKTDSFGDTIWTRTYSGGNGGDGWSVQQTADGGYIIAGKIIQTGGRYWDVYLVKTDSLGIVYTGLEEQRTKPLANLLLDVSPNPFTKTATIRYQLLSASPVRILAFDITGRTVATLLDQNQHAGTYQLIWQPEELPQGIYFIKLQIPGSSFTQRCLYLHSDIR